MILRGLLMKYLYYAFSFLLLLIIGELNLSSQTQNLPANDLTPDFKVPAQNTDFEKRVVMVPMRDGTKLYTVIVIPKGAKNAPILLTRTPYNASKRLARNDSPHMLSVLPLSDGEFGAE